MAAVCTSIAKITLLLKAHNGLMLQCVVPLQKSCLSKIRKRESDMKVYITVTDGGED